MRDELIALDHATRAYRIGGRDVPVVEDVSLSLRAGETLCLVGESGCGKTTTGRMLAGLIRPSAGVVRFGGRDVWSLRGRDWREFRLGVQLIHQDPFASLNPTMRIRDILAAPLRRHRITGSGAALDAELRRLLAAVELASAADLLDAFPHQISGGQRQRVAIARALTVRPRVLVADEAVSMVDVSIRLSILDTLRALQTQMGLAVVLVTHDLAIARHLAGTGRIAVMYLGRIVEVGKAAQIVTNPRHPYTRALVAAAPADPREARGTRPPIPILGADVPNVADRPSGCAFHPRCPLAVPGLCDARTPELESDATGAVACHLATAAPVSAGAAPGDAESVPLPTGTAARAAGRATSLPKGGPTSVPPFHPRDGARERHS